MLQVEEKVHIDDDGMLPANIVLNSEFAEFLSCAHPALRFIDAAEHALQQASERAQAAARSISARMNSETGTGMLPQGTLEEQQLGYVCHEQQASRFPSQQPMPQGTFLSQTEQQQHQQQQQQQCHHQASEVWHVQPMCPPQHWPHGYTPDSTPTQHQQLVPPPPPLPHGTYCAPEHGMLHGGAFPFDHPTGPQHWASQLHSPLADSGLSIWPWPAWQQEFARPPPPPSF